MLMIRKLNQRAVFPSVNAAIEKILKSSSGKLTRFSHQIKKPSMMRPTNVDAATQVFCHSPFWASAKANRSEEIAKPKLAAPAKSNGSFFPPVPLKLSSGKSIRAAAKPSKARIADK